MNGLVGLAAIRSRRPSLHPVMATGRHLARVLQLRPRLGIEVGSDTIRAVLVVRRRIVRAMTVQLPELGSVEAGLKSVMDSMPLAGAFKARVFGAMGAASSQVRRLTNLPDVKSERALREIIRTNGSRFFLKNGIPLLTSSVRGNHEGSGWAAALDEPPVRALALACRSHRLKLSLVAPAVITLPLAMRGESFVATDAGTLVEARVDADGALVDIRRGFSATLGQPNGSDLISPVLLSLGDDAVAYAVAYGATELDGSEPLAIHQRELRRFADTSVAKWRQVLAIVTLAVLLVVVGAFPLIEARREAARASERLSIIDRPNREARWTEAELARTTQALDEIDVFAGDRRSTIAFLAALTQELPEDAWLQTVHLDREGGTATALAPRASSAVAGFAAMQSITSVAIVGTVLQQQIGSDHFERVTVRFRWRSAFTATQVRSTSVERVRQ